MMKDTSGRSRPGATTFVLLTLALSWPIWVVTWLATGQPGTATASAAIVVAIYVGSFAPGVAAALLSLLGPEGELMAWLRTFVRFRSGWRAYTAALLPLPIAILLLTIVLGYEPRIAGLHGRPPLLLYLTIFPASLVNGAATALMGAGPLGEEGGWRGYLLPHLLERHSEARASLVVGAVWALWHLPIMAMFADWRGGVPLPIYLPLYAVGVFGLSFILTRVWLLGGRSLVPCIWLHGLVNAVGGVAFEHSLWTSRWSPAAGVAHFAISAAIAAGVLLTAKHRAARRAVAAFARSPSTPQAR